MANCVPRATLLLVVMPAEFVAFASLGIGNPETPPESAG